jgi:hypothetical protein
MVTAIASNPLQSLSVAFRARVARRARASLSARASGRDGSSDFPGFFRKRIEEGKKALEAATSEFEDAHKKNVEKLDAIAKDDVELLKWILGGEKSDLSEVHKKNIEFLDDLSKRDVEFAKKVLKFSDVAPGESAYDVIEVEFEEK